MVRCVSVLLALAFAVVVACGVQSTSSSPPASSPPASSSSTRGESDEWELGAAFGRCPALEHTSFDGAYAVVDRHAADTPWDESGWARSLENLAGFEVDRGHIRAGVPLRNDFCFTRVAEQSDTTLIAEALWHEDVLDPGDASVVHVGLRRAGARVAFVVGESEADVRARLASATPALHRLEGVGPIGERFEASRAFVDLWDAPRAKEDAACIRMAPMPQAGRYRVDVAASLGMATAALPENRRQAEEALLLGSVANLIVDEQGFELGVLRRGACWLAFEPRADGFEARVRVRGEYDEERDSWRMAFVRITAEPSRLRLRIAQAQRALDTQPDIVLERSGTSPGLASWVSAAPRPPSFRTHFFSLGERSALLVAGDTEDVLARTSDAGATWTPLAWNHGRVTAALGRGRELWIATQGTLWHSVDDGVRFVGAPLPAREGDVFKLSPHAFQMLWSPSGEPWITLPDRISAIGADGSFTTVWQLGDYAGLGLVYAYVVEDGGVLVSANPFQLYRGRPGAVSLEPVPRPPFEAPRGLSGIVELVALPSGEVGSAPSGAIFVRKRGQRTWERIAGSTSCRARALVAIPGSQDEVLLGCEDDSIRAMRLDGQTRDVFTEKLEAGLVHGPVIVGTEVWFAYYRANANVGGIAVAADGSVRRIRVPAPPTR